MTAVSTVRDTSNGWYPAFVAVIAIGPDAGAVPVQVVPDPVSGTLLSALSTAGVNVSVNGSFATIGSGEEVMLMVGAAASTVRFALTG